MKHISIAIDGPAGAGKSTLARQAARIASRPPSSARKVSPVTIRPNTTGCSPRAAAWRARASSLASDGNTGAGSQG